MYLNEGETLDQITDIQRPNIKEVTSLRKNVSRVVLEPFEPNYARVLGTALRRIMLSSIPGYAITEVEIEGVVHEYSALEGVQEDILLILLNLKEVAVRCEGLPHHDPVLELVKSGVGPVSAGEINCKRVFFQHLKEKGEEYHLETEDEYEVHNEHDKILEGGIDMSGFVNTLREDREKIIKNKR